MLHDIYIYLSVTLLCFNEIPSDYPRHSYTLCNMFSNNAN